MSLLCIFCASPTFYGDGVDPRVKTKVIITPNDQYPSLVLAADYGDEPPTLAFERDSAIQGNLSSFFILKRIFKLSNDTLTQFLTHFNDNGHPEDWISSCASCRKSVNQFFQKLKQISSLERQLIKLETELKGKIEQTKDIGGNGNLIWTQIRKKVLSNYISQGQAKIDFSNTDTEVHADLEPTSDSTVHLEDLNEEQDNNTNNSLPRPPTAVSERPSTSSGQLELNTTKKLEQHKHPIKTKYLSNRRSLRIDGVSYRGCLHCPYYTGCSKLFEAHLKLHEEGAPHMICEACNHYVRPWGMLRHLVRCSGTPKTSNPHYTVFRKGDKGLQYTCRHCPYKTPKISLVLKHAKLHEEGSSAEVCGECGCYLPPKRLKFHQTLVHRTKDGSSSSQLRKRTDNCPLFNAAKSQVGKKKRKIPNEEMFITGDIPNDNDNGDLVANDPPPTPANAPEPSTEADNIPDKQPPSNESSLGPIKRFPLPGLLPEQFPRYSVFRDPSLDPASLFYKCLECCYQGTTRHKLMNHLKLHQLGSGAVSCASCGWLVDPESMKAHDSTYHSGRN